MKRVKSCLFVMSMFLFGMIFSIMTNTSEQNAYAQSSNFTKFTSKDVEEEKEAKLSQFVLKIQNASTINLHITQFQISGNCKYEFGTINISLSSVENTGLNLLIDFQLHDKESQKWELYSMTSLSGINETDINNLIYELS